MFPIDDTAPRRNPPVMIWVLILVNSTIFLFELSFPPPVLEELFYLLGVVPARFTHPDWAAWVGIPVDGYWPFFTHMFLHAGWLHIVGNMWMLWIFGDNIEDRMGPARFLIFYLLCGLIAGAVHSLTNPDSTVPAVGASGAIAGVMGAYLVLFPNARVIALFPVFFWPFFFELPAVVFLGVWFVTQLFGGFAVAGAPEAGGVAWWAHIGGFASGVLLYRFFLKPERGRKFEPDEYGIEAAWR